jgi:hypothetical protein
VCAGEQRVSHVPHIPCRHRYGTSMPWRSRACRIVSCAPTALRVPVVCSSSVNVRSACSDGVAGDDRGRRRRPHVRFIGLSDWASSRRARCCVVVVVGGAGDSAAGGGDFGDIGVQPPERVAVAGPLTLTPASSAIAARVSPRACIRRCSCRRRSPPRESQRCGLAPTRRPPPGGPARPETTQHHPRCDAHAPGEPRWLSSALRELSCALPISS